MILYLVIFISAFFLTYLVKLMAQKKSIMDLPNERSSHALPTPRGGGLAIAVVWFLGISYLNYVEIISSDIYYALMTGVLIAIISFIDDIYTLPYLPRIIVQALSTAIALYFVGGIGVVDFGFFTIESQILLNAVAFVGVLWFINLFNFIDGINGYSSSGAICISGALYFFTGDILTLILLLSVLGFLPWNWGKAKIFMGDIGSTLLGFTIAVLIIHYNKMAQLSIFNGLIITSVFWFDATYTLFKRYLNKEQLSKPHKKHAYQRVVQYGFSHPKTSLIMIALNGLLFCIATFSDSYPLYSLVFLIVAIIVLFLVYKLIDSKKPFKD
jgi:UDP-N-acetylmuramyl pentapeptide phosphotransferase/UDP-N-acetylglucosamine-1-phosphate transferase